MLITLSSLLLANTIHGQTTCASTADCEADGEYCSEGICVQTGSCQEEVDCFNRDNRFTTDDCVGYLECKDNQCIKTCSDSFCKPGSNVEDLFCPTVMCDIQNCERAVSCVNNNCDTCAVLYFDAKGSQICNQDTTISCSSNSNCKIDIGGNTTKDDIVTIMAVDAAPYCAAGTCAAPGTCSTDNDCVNPSNHYEIIECAGPILCDQGQCTRDCSTGSMCKEGVNVVNCFVDPCTVTGCAESAECIADYCGGCNALHFDAAGNVLAECDDPFTIPETCTQDNDCDDGSGRLPTHFCSAGSCKPFGECSTTSDCLNPSNDVGFISCTGFQRCTSNGQCEHVCSNDEHCCFIPVECTAEEKEACPDAVMCVKDNCNDSGNHCGTWNGNFYFDSAGNSICVQNEPPTPLPTAMPIPPPTDMPTRPPTVNNGTTADGTDLADGAEMVGSTLSLMVVIVATIAAWMV